MEPLTPKEPRTCDRRGLPIIDLKDHKAYIARRQGLTGWSYLHTACMTRRDRQDLVDNLT
jgi:hypothetical protein